MKTDLKEMKLDSKKILEFLEKNKYVLIVVTVGILLMLIPWGAGDSADKKAAVSSAYSDLEFTEYSLGDVERRMEQVLSQIDGAGDVTVMLTLKSSSEKVVAVDEDMSASGTGENAKLESSVKTVVISPGQGIETPVTVKYIYPEYKGALVVSKGAGSPTVKLRLTEAVSNLTGLGVDKISVIKMQEGK